MASGGGRGVNRRRTRPVLERSEDLLLVKTGACTGVKVGRPCIFFLLLEVALHLLGRFLASKGRGIHVGLDDTDVVVGRFVHPGIDFGSGSGFRRVEGRLGKPFFEIAKDVDRLGNDDAVVDERGNEACGIDLEVGILGRSIGFAACIAIGRDPSQMDFTV